MIVRELITKLGFNVDDAGMRKAEAGISRIKKQADFAAQALMGVGASLAGAASAKSAIAIADSMQNIRSRIGMLPQTIGDVGEAFDEVGRRASATGMAIEAYAGLYTRVGNAAKTTFPRKRIYLASRIRLPRRLLLAGLLRKRHLPSCSNSPRRLRLVCYKAMNSAPWPRPRRNTLINWRLQWASRESSSRRWQATAN